MSKSIINNINNISDINEGVFIEMQAVYTVNSAGVKKVEKQIEDLTNWTEDGDFTEVYDVLEDRRNAGESAEYEIPPRSQNEATRGDYKGYCAYITLDDDDFDVEYIEA